MVSTFSFLIVLNIVALAVVDLYRVIPKVHEGKLNLLVYFDMMYGKIRQLIGLILQL